MYDLDASVVRRPLTATSTSKLDQIEVFRNIDSTNSYLMQQPAPTAGRFRVALADHQTAGRGRHDRIWQSPPGAGLCLSIAYTFAAMPDKLPNLTLSLGVGVVHALSALGIDGISLKWPNDIVASNGKLGGMLAEVKSKSGSNVTVVAGIGLNVDLTEPLELGAEQEWAQRVVDLKSINAKPPSREILAGTFIEHLSATLVEFDELGFDRFVDKWRELDWLLGKQITVAMADRQITGTAAGVDIDGALLVDTEKSLERVISGSIILQEIIGNER